MQIIAEGKCALGPVQLVVSWRMLTTLEIKLRDKFALAEGAATAVCQAIAAIAESGPISAAPALVLGGGGLLQMPDGEDAKVVEAAFAGNADLLLTHDIEDFAQHPKTRTLLAGSGGNARTIMFSHPPHADLLIATPQAAIGWLREQAPAPVDLATYRHTGGA